MKISQHNTLAVASVTLLLLTALAPGQANARDNVPQGTRYAQNDATTNAQEKDRKKSKRSSDTQNSATANAQDNDKEKDKPTPRNSDTQNEAPAVSRSEAAAIAERATGGRVLSVREDGRYWQVKVLVDEKRVRFVNVDMRSGRVR